MSLSLGILFSLSSALFVQGLSPLRSLQDAPCRGEYQWQTGYLPSDHDVQPPTDMTVEQAKANCTSIAKCVGITYVGSNSTQSKVHVFFKSIEGPITKSANWSTWTQHCVPSPPADTIEIGGDSNLVIRLRQDYYTIQNLSRVQPAADSLWSFTRPVTTSSANPNMAILGDITIRVQKESETDNRSWSFFNSAAMTANAEPLKVESPTLAAQDITALLNTSSADSLPVQVVRAYEKSSDGKAMIMRFNVTCVADEAVRLGGVGFALPESAGNPGKDIDAVVWNDPHIGGQHGFVEFVRIAGDHATLLVVPGDPLTTPLQGWRPMLEDQGHGDSWEWMPLTSAWAADWAENTQFPFLNISNALANIYPEFAVNPQTPWPSCTGPRGMPKVPAAKNPWNKPTELVLKPKETVSFALRFQLVGGGGPRNRNKALETMGEPVIHGVPGYVLSTEMKTAALFVLAPTDRTVNNVVAEPIDQASIAVGKGTRTEGGFMHYPVSGAGRGRVRVTVTYSDKTSSEVHYYILPPFTQQVSKLGRFYANVTWLPRDYPDPFGRSASVMPWDRSMCDDGNVCGHVLQDARAYDVGLSDDAGGSGPLGMASKVRASPDQFEVSRIDEYIQWTLYGYKPDTAKAPYKSLQIQEGDESVDNNTWNGIRMTMFYYSDAGSPSNTSSGHFPYKYTEADKCHKPFGSPVWCMSEHMANATYRGFNYPHQVASYWAMYHVARHYDRLKTRMPWHWYLERAAKTILQLGTPGVGFMDGTVFREVLNALKVEGAGNTTMANYSQRLDANMKSRQDRWQFDPHPYGSEFAFDTTGQEEVVVWNIYYRNETAAKNVVDHVLSYMRSSPTWVYNGGTRSWGDGGNNGKYLPNFGTGLDTRGNMHYRAGLNMIPLIEWYRLHPDELFLLEIAMGAISGQMGNIDESGAPSMMWHAFPYVMDYDPHSGDFGLGFFGHSLESGLYYVEDKSLGTLCYLCDVSVSGNKDGDGAGNGTVSILPRDSYHINAFLEPVALYIQAEAGTIASLSVNLQKRMATVQFTESSAEVHNMFSMFRLKLTKTSKDRPGSGFAVDGAELVRGAFAIKPSSGTTTATITWS
ncbi:uncharacterized protein LOC135808135 [Sycon ciliatum]|uniref:uncharacterized protein LOC135808135 n=1 Tax=Sycon ciliatum TaxID=27933 RepID=UPI0031F6FE9D